MHLPAGPHLSLRRNLMGVRLHHRESPVFGLLMMRLKMVQQQTTTIKLQVRRCQGVMGIMRTRIIWSGKEMKDLSLMMRYHTRRHPLLLPWLLNIRRAFLLLPYPHIQIRLLLLPDLHTQIHHSEANVNRHVCFINE